jgi:hypothetical protein
MSRPTRPWGNTPSPFANALEDLIDAETAHLQALSVLNEVRGGGYAWDRAFHPPPPIWLTGGGVCAAAEGGDAVGAAHHLAGGAEGHFLVVGGHPELN